MFTGLIEEVGTINHIKRGADSSQITINSLIVIKDINIGDSISTNGICLTVIDFNTKSFTVDVMSETLKVTNLGTLLKGDKVNLERALRLQDRLGGHLVSGHVDGIGEIVDLKSEDNAKIITVSTQSKLLRYIIYKGSIAIDGISLTVFYVDDSIFKVSVIPHTNSITTLLDKNVGDTVNLECDIIGKYIEQLIKPTDAKDKSKADISINFLRENGFI